MPLDYRYYPQNWKTEIRPAILKRCDNHCERCGVPNGAIGYRDSFGFFIPFIYDERFSWLKQTKGVFNALDMVKAGAYSESPTPLATNQEYVLALWHDLCSRTPQSMSVYSIAEKVFCDDKKKTLEVIKIMRGIVGDYKGKVLKIALQIAHLDHDSSCGDLDRLEAMCQKCHLEYDMAMHIERRKANEPTYSQPLLPTKEQPQ